MLTSSKVFDYSLNVHFIGDFFQLMRSKSWSNKTLRKEEGVCPQMIEVVIGTDIQVGLLEEPEQTDLLLRGFDSLHSKEVTEL